MGDHSLDTQLKTGREDHSTGTHEHLPMGLAVLRTKEETEPWLVIYPAYKEPLSSSDRAYILICSRGKLKRMKAIPVSRPLLQN